MNERIEKLALQAGLESVSDNLFYAYNENLERFAELVRQDEREACVKIALRYEPTERHPNVTYAADEMRARGNHAEN